ncbi:MAG: dTDP-4-dehydrorhamnose reductase [Longimonas sp.]|uniref:dTDP-4-dehydrorhamnose reductase n=1 Tax=Longimonas sp. TaxID=2039626 RepID=UPI0033571242
MLYNRVLITGANGLLGQALTKRLSQLPEYDVLATARDDAPRFDTGSCGYAPLDITRADDIEALFDDFTPNVLVNCAAMTDVDGCAEDKDACWATNATAVEQLADACRRHGTRLVQVSTDFVFDGEDGPYTEDARPNPVNYYGRSKLAGENAVRASGIAKWAIVRTVLVYGTGTNLGRGTIVTWLMQKLEAGEPVHIVTDQWRTPTYVNDLARGIERVLHLEKTGVYHVSGRELVSIYDLATTVAEVCNYDASLITPVTSDFFGDAVPRPPRTGFIILKAETELGYRPTPLRGALRSVAEELGVAS